MVSSRFLSAGIRGAARWAKSAGLLLGLLLPPLGLTVPACSTDAGSENRPLLVYAAASLATVLPDVGEDFRWQHPGLQIRHHFAATSLLARQIESGARADVYFSADPQWVDYLEARGLVDATSRVEPMANHLVLIVPVGESRITRLADLGEPWIERIAVADWRHVPAGRYAASVLQRAGVWDRVEPKLIPAVDVRAALAYVARAEVDCGLVYATDARVSDRVRVLPVIPDSLQLAIRYVAVRLRGLRHPQAGAYLRFLAGTQAATVFRRYGFVTPSPGTADE